MFRTPLAYRMSFRPATAINARRLRLAVGVAESA